MLFPSKGYLLFPEIYGLNGLFTSKRNAQRNFLHSHSYKLLFLPNFLNSVTKLVAVNGAVLPETPSGNGMEQGTYGYENIFLVFSMFCTNSLPRCYVTNVVCF